MTVAQPDMPFDPPEGWAVFEDFVGIGFWEIDTETDTVLGSPEYYRILGLEPVANPLPMSAVRAMRMKGIANASMKGIDALSRPATYFREQSFVYAA